MDVRSPCLVSPKSTGSNSQGDLSLSSRRDGRIIAGSSTPSPGVHSQYPECIRALVLYFEGMGDGFSFDHVFKIKHVVGQE